MKDELGMPGLKAKTSEIWLHFGKLSIQCWLTSHYKFLHLSFSALNWIFLADPSSGNMMQTIIWTVKQFFKRALGVVQFFSHIEPSGSAGCTFFLTVSYMSRLYRWATNGQVRCFCLFSTRDVSLNVFLNHHKVMSCVVDVNHFWLGRVDH